MAYSTSTPPMVVAETLNGNKLWIYSSADDDATVNGAGYFTNGALLGMKVGDAVLVIDTATPKTSLCYVSAVSTTATTSFAAVA